MDSEQAGVNASAQKDISHNKKRELWVDVAKGIGIIAVVIGHTGVPIGRYLYWFHMPLFFIISGYLFRPPVDWSSFRSQTIKRTRQLLIPYIAFLLLLSVFQHIHHRFPGNFNVLAGGRFVGGDFSVFWFITCLYVTQIAFAAIHLKFRTASRILLVVGIAYLLAHIEAAINRSNVIKVPWAVDISLMAISYYSVGYYAKSWLSRVRRIKLVLMAAVLLSAVFIVGDAARWFVYSLDMKQIRYNNALLDLAIPLVLVFAVYGISQALSQMRVGRVLSVFGAASLPIMYLHTFVYHELVDFVRCRYEIRVLIAILVPLAAWWILNRFALTRFLFLGSGNIWNKEKDTAARS